jgi:hypothetical protein
MNCSTGVTPLCAKYCMDVHESGVSVGTLVGSCIVANCAAVCATLPGAPLDACETCVYEQCPSEMNACLAEADCYDLLACTTACAPNDSACTDACVMAHPDSLGLLQSVQTCAQAHCANPCTTV